MRMINVLKSFSLFITLVFFAGQVLANTAAPQKTVEVMTSQMIAQLKANKTKLQQNSSVVENLVLNIVIPHVNFEEASKRVLAKHWRTATPAERKAFEKEFEKMLIRTYSAVFKSYNNQTVNFQGSIANPKNSNFVEVRSLIKEAGKPDVPVNYRLINKGNQWKIYDIIIDNISLVSNYRAQFSESINKRGLTAVIEEMRQHNQKVQ